VRTRPVLILPIAVVAGLALALPTTADAADTATPVTRLGDGPASTVLLPTGDRVHLIGAAGHERMLIQPAAASGPGRTLVSQRFGAQVSVLPAVAEPYLGRFLDPALFDVTWLRTQVAADGRIPVRLTYRGSAPAAPGVTITSAADGRARGYLTARSAAGFGRALAAQWSADRAAHWPVRSSLFTGITGMSADGPRPKPVRPSFAMVTLVVKVIGADGKPQPAGVVGLLNVDDGRKYLGPVTVVNGEGRVSVPTGTYSAISDDFSYTAAGDVATVRVSTATDVTVTRAGQTITLDHRRATQVPRVQVPRPAERVSSTFDWTRADAAGQVAAGYGVFLGAGATVFVAPAKPARVGQVSTRQTWALNGPGEVPRYSYSLAAASDRIGADQLYRFAPADLGTIRAAYYGDGPVRTAGFARYPTYPAGLSDPDGGAGAGTYDPVRRGTRRTEYVGSAGAVPVWFDGLLVNPEGLDDTGFVDSPTRTIDAGSTRSIDWLRGPLPAVIPEQPAPATAGADAVRFCYGCRSATTLSLGLAPFTDSDPTHVGSLFSARDEVPVARFRLYRNDILIADQEDTLGTTVTVKPARARYRAVLDVDRRLQDPVQSTRTRTELGFTSTANKGPKLPTGWGCAVAGCRVLPLVQARVVVPTDLNGIVRKGFSTVTVTVTAAQNATVTAAAGAGLEIRPAGQSWSPIVLTPIGGGVFRGAIDSADVDGAGLDPVPVDVRVQGADKSGNTFTQTILRAFRGPGS